MTCRPVRNWFAPAAAALSVLAAGAGTAAPPPPADAGFPEAALQALEWREVGPYRGGRSAAVAGVPGRPGTYYFGAAGGGVWKSIDGGRSWKSASDGFLGGSIGAVAVSGWDPNIVYVGGGEKTVRGNVSHGDGVWKSTDAGKTWKHVGLADSRHIPRIRIHPRDPDLVYAAVLGHLFGPSSRRGVYRSADGGRSWERILHVSDEAGAVDLAMDPTNPRILYATFWRVLRTPWSLESGGPGSGLWKSTDGGDTWSELTTKEGMPAPPLGIMGVAVSPTDGDNVYAVVEAEKGGVFRSRDGGETWSRTNTDRKLRQRAWYYTRIYADPADEETVYVLNVRFHRSRDGGKTFEEIPTPHGDNHDLWIAPEDRCRMIEANDGGANVSTDCGESWSRQDNQPTAQIYRVSTDGHFPYRLLGAQQDNTALRILSRSQRAGIGFRDWEPTAGGESGHIVADPEDPEIVYGGSYGGFLMRLDHRRGERRLINVWPDNPMGWGAGDLKHRFQWNFPIFFSPHDPDTLYAAANVLFKTTDDGQSWKQISPDLTRNDKTKQGSSGGPITQDNTSVEYYCTIFAALESPHEPGVLWTGSDDGLIHLSRDAGKTWKDVTPKILPAWSQINSLEAHPFEPGGLYVAATRYKLDDFRPYLYRTTDYGQTWTEITGGIPEDHFTRVIRADPDRPGLLYAGTERGPYASFDDGASWQSLQLNLPQVPITDLAVKERDLVAATQGRGFWILDDLTPLHQLTPEVAASPLHLFAPRAAYRLEVREPDEEPEGMGANPPPGVRIHYLLGQGAAAGPVTLEILDAAGAPIRTFPNAAGDGGEEGRTAAAAEPEAGTGEGSEEEAPTPPAEVGLNRFVWDLRHEDAEKFDGLVLWADEGLRGPRAVPGTYRARLTAGGQTRTQPFRVLVDPRISASGEDLGAQLEFLLGVRDKLTEIHRAIRRIREVREQLADLVRRLGKREPVAQELVAAAEVLTARISGVEEALYQTKNQSPQDPLNFPIRLNDKLASLGAAAALGPFRPTDQARQVRSELTAAIDARLAELQGIWEEALPAFNDLARRSEVPAILLPAD